MVAIDELFQSTVFLSFIFVLMFILIVYLFTFRSTKIQSFSARFPRIFMIFILIILALLANIYFTIWLPYINGDGI